MEGRVAWIIGASSGIGEATAREAVTRGYKTVISARRSDRLEAVRAELGDRVEVVPIDLEHAALEEVVVEVWAAHGPVDLAVISAGVSQRALAVDTEAAVVQRLLRLNLEAATRLGGALATHMTRRGRGAIVVVSSLAGVVPAPYRSGYSAAKHGLHGYFATLNAELAGSGVAVRVVVPGFVATGISQSALTGDGTPYRAADAALARGKPPEVVARAILRAPSRRRCFSYVALGIAGHLAIFLSRRLPRLYNRIALRRETRARHG